MKENSSMQKKSSSIGYENVYDKTKRAEKYNESNLPAKICAACGKLMT